MSDDEAAYTPSSVRQTYDQRGPGAADKDLYDSIGKLSLFDDVKDGPADDSQGQDKEVKEPAQDKEVLPNDDDKSKDDGDIDDPEQKEDVETKEDAAPEGEEEQAPIESIQDLADALEVDVKELDTFKVTVKANGEDKTVTLDELRRGYQRNSGNTQKVMQLETQLQDVGKQVEAKAQQFDQDTKTLALMFQEAKKIMMSDVNVAEMQQLRAANPAEWSARNYEIQQRLQQIDQLYNSASTKYQQFEDEQAKATKEDQKVHFAKELERLQTYIPEWDQGVRDSTVSYLDKTYGFTDEDFNSVVDSRLIALAHKARLYDEQMAVASKVKKKVAKLPKLAVSSNKPGRKAEPSRKRNYEAAKNKLKRSGSMRDAADLVGFLNLD